MADTFTTNLVLTKPEIGSSENTWGQKLSENWDIVDALFQSGPALQVAKGGTGAISAAAARTNLGLGTISTQNASAVAITGGTATFASAVISGTWATMDMRDPAAGTDAKGYQFRVANGTMSLLTLNDAGSGADIVFTAQRSGAIVSSVSFYAPIYVDGFIVYHQNNISSATIQEGQIADAAVFTRNASTETISGQWNFTTVPQKTAGGKFLHYASASYVGGAVTVSTSDPSGIPATGDRWVKYVP